MVKDTVINQRLLQSDGFQSINKVLIPYETCLLLLINVFDQFEHMILGITMNGLHALWEFHIDVHFNSCLWVSHDEVNLI
jgi:hypothetical protein